MSTNNATPPTITLYTNHLCPYAHRAHIALAELGLPFEEIIIDLSTPRPQWYLDINPRGLVPTIKYSVPGVFDEPEIITESQVVAQFLVDSFPSHLQPGTRDSPTAPLIRARQAWFIKTWEEKVGSQLFALFRAQTAEEKQAKGEEWVKVLEKEIEPLLADAAPFFGGSKELTFVEAITAPFLLRFWAFAKDGELVSENLLKQFEGLKNLKKWKEAVEGKESVTEIYDEKAIIEGTKARVAKMAAAAKKN